ncbi:MAG: DNA topoisomerase IV subunit A [Candidatus Freyarchaeota archaeon]
MITGDRVIKTLSGRWKGKDAVVKRLKVKNMEEFEKVLQDLAEAGVIETLEKDGKTYLKLADTEAKKQRAIKKEKEFFKKEIQRRKEVDKNLSKMGKQLYQEILQGEFPHLDIPSRSTSNIVFDEDLRQYVLGDKTVTRTAKSLGQIRSFSQLIWVMRFLKELLKLNKSSTLRDVYYSSEAYQIKFADQQESDTCITDVEAILGVPREDFKVFPEERSAIYGDLIVEYTTPARYAGRRVAMNDSPDGVMIGPHLVNSKFIKTTADKVIAIESGGMFTRFVEEEVNEKYNAILIHTAGQAPRSTRRLIRRLHYELNLPVYIFVDADPWGFHIAQVLISGSASSAHLLGLATPDAMLLGVWASDIERYNLPSDKLTELDIKRCKDLLRDPRYQSKFWQDELKTFLRIKRKAEQQAFSRYGLTYVVDEYLPAKLKMVDEMRRKGLI